MRLLHQICVTITLEIIKTVFYLALTQIVLRFFFCLFFRFVHLYSSFILPRSLLYGQKDLCVSDVLIVTIHTNSCWSNLKYVKNFRRGDEKPTYRVEYKGTTITEYDLTVVRPPTKIMSIFCLTTSSEILPKTLSRTLNDPNAAVFEVV